MIAGHTRGYPELGATVWCTHNPPEEPCPVCEGAIRAAQEAKPLPDHEGATTRVRVKLEATFVIPGDRVLPDWSPAGVMCVGLQTLIDKGRLQGPITLEPGARVTLTQVDAVRASRRPRRTP